MLFVIKNRKRVNELKTGFNKVVRIFLNSGNLGPLLILATEDARDRFDLMLAVTLGFHATPAGYRAIEKLARNMDAMEALKLEMIIAYAFEGYLEQAMRNYKGPKDFVTINELLAEVRTQYYYVDVRLRALDRSAPEWQEMVKVMAKKKQSLARTATKIANLENELALLREDDVSIKLTGPIVEPKLFVLSRKRRSEGGDSQRSDVYECRCGDYPTGSCGGEFDEPDYSAVVSSRLGDGSGCKCQRKVPRKIPEAIMKMILADMKKRLGLILTPEEKIQLSTTGMLQGVRWIISDL